MKKLLNILTILGLSSIVTSCIISCEEKKIKIIKQSEKKNNEKLIPKKIEKNNLKLEQNYNIKKSYIDDLIKEKNELQNKIKELTNNEKELIKKLENKQNEINNLTENKIKLEKEKNILEQEKNRLFQKFDPEQIKIYDLKQDLTIKQNYIDNLIKEKNELQSKIEELNNNEKKLIEKLQSKQSEIIHLIKDRTSFEQEKTKLFKELNPEQMEKFNDFLGFEKTIENLKIQNRKKINDKQNEIDNNKKEINKLINNKNDLEIKLENKNNIIEELNKELSKLRNQVNLQKINISDLKLVDSPTKIIVPIKQTKKDKIYASEFNISNSLSKNILKELKEKIDSSLNENDFRIIFKNRNIISGVSFIELSEPKKVEFKVIGVNKAKGISEWIKVDLPKATLKKL